MFLFSESIGNDFPLADFVSVAIQDILLVPDVLSAFIGGITPERIGDSRLDFTEGLHRIVVEIDFERHLHALSLTTFGSYCKPNEQ